MQRILRFITAYVSDLTYSITSSATFFFLIIYVYVYLWSI